MKMLFYVLLILPLSVCAAELTTPKEKAEAFFAAVVQGDMAGGYDRLFIGSTIPGDKPQAVALIKTQTQNSLSLYGTILGYDLIKEEKFGSAVVRLVYLLKAEKAPTIWEFHFYKPKEAWFLLTLGSV